MNPSQTIAGNASTSTGIPRRYPDPPSRPERRGPELIRLGATDEDLRERGTRAVFAALVSTAMSAQNRGERQDDWHAALLRADSGLGRQAHLDSRKQLRPPREVMRDFEKAWTLAEKNLTETPRTLGQEHFSHHAQLLRQALRVLPTERWPLGERERAVLAVVLGTAARHGTLTPTAPSRAVQEAAGLPSPIAAHRALRRLAKADLLELLERGQPGRSSRTAARYGLTVVLEQLLLGVEG